MDHSDRKPLRRVSAAASPLSAEQMPFVGGGEMGQLMREKDWSQTALGPVETWSPSLRMIVRFLLANRFPMLLWWGPEFLQIYNDAYRPVLGTKHPHYLGRPVRECWTEIWDVIGPLIETPFRGGPATWMEDIQLEVNRHGFFEETHFTIAYSPVPDETAATGIGGVLATVHEISEKVVGERRIVVLRDLGAHAAEAKFAEEACQIAAATLGQHAKDVPFALLYLMDADGQHAKLAASAGIERPDPALSPMIVTLDATTSADARQPWPLAEARRTEKMQVVKDLASCFASVPPGPWSDPPTCAAVVPIHSHVAHQLAGFLVAGVSARVRFGDAYAGFLELVSGQIATAIANARAYEEERKRAEALAAIDRAKTTFFSNVSHEFRTPLTLMLGPLEDVLARRETLPADMRNDVELMQRNGLRLLKLVNTLLDFARIEAGRVQASYAPTDLASYTAELASAFRSLVEKAGLRLIVECPPVEGGLAAPVYVDREMWEKVVLNLLSNAFKFTFDGSITVGLRAVEDGRAVELVVRDTGTGIPAAELPRLFERFHRVEGTRARTHEGSGIGLALVRELVLLHGGTIRAASEEEVGTAFYVRLPTGSAHLPAERVRAPSALASTALGAAAFVEEADRWLPDGAENGATGASHGLAAAMPTGMEDAEPARLVLADDNADMRDYLRRLLSGRYTVEVVANGAAALAAIRRQRPDLVLADVMMPEMDGFELLRALRVNPATATLPVMLLSARAGEEATVEGLEAGADDYLVKPFSAREVLTRVAARLEIARTRADTTRRMNEFLGIASHELRTPLTSMTANVQLARRQLGRASQQMARLESVNGSVPTLERSELLLERAERQMIRLDRLVGDLLDVSRIQAGKLEMRPEPCDVQDIVREAVHEQRAAWPARVIELDLPHRARFLAFVDPDRVGQVVTNLLTNALKYAPSAEPIAVRMRRQDAVARVEVCDRGPGLSAEQQAHLFERFYRVPGIEQQSGSGVGLGLGLHICRTIIERHGGQVGVDSAPGVASTFWFTLPLADAPCD